MNERDVTFSLDKEFLPIAPIHISDAERDNSYQESKILMKVPKILPTWDAVGQNVEHNVIRWKRKFERVAEILRERRDFARNRHKVYDAAWQKLTEDELALRRTFIEFASFCIENDEKRARAMSKMESDYKLIEQRENDIEHLTERCAVLAEKLKQFEDLLKKYRDYEDFLGDAVRASSGFFPNIHSIVNRYEMLNDTKLKASEKQTELVLQEELAERAYEQLIRDKEAKLHLMKKAILDLQRRSNQCHSRVLAAESTISAVRETMFDKEQEIRVVTQVARNLYLNICERMEFKKRYENGSFTDHMKVIKRNMEYLERLVTQGVPELRPKKTVQSHATATSHLARTSKGSRPRSILSNKSSGTTGTGSGSTRFTPSPKGTGSRESIEIWSTEARDIRKE